MTPRLLLTCALLLLGLSAIPVALAQAPQTMAFQGFLATSAGQPVNGATAMTFRLYPVPVGGTPVWTESQTVAVTAGSYTVLLGSVTPLSVPFNLPYFLGVTVGTDAEMAPRQALAAAPYALGVAPGAVGPAQLGGTIPTASGGTGATSLPLDGLLLGKGVDPVAAVSVGQAGTVLVGSGGAPAWSGSPSLSGNLTMPSTAGPTSGTLMKGPARFLHNSGEANTFLGVQAGVFDPVGTYMVGVGTSVLSSLTTGNANTAVGAVALRATTTGNGNTAIGSESMSTNTIGELNTAVGYRAIDAALESSFNVGIGAMALYQGNGNNNTAVGARALQGNFFGNGNIAVGYQAGWLTNGSANIFIGNQGTLGESNTIRIGDVQTRTFIAGVRGTSTPFSAIPVLINSDGQLVTTSSSRRMKERIADMADASRTLMKLRPVTFYYKAHADVEGRALQYGLVAEEVAEVDPGLVARSADGEIETVLYQFLAPMLLNEYQKQQRVLEAQARVIRGLERRIEQLERGRRQP